MIDNYEEFKTKVGNIFVKYLYSFTLNNIEEIRHLLSSDLYNKTKKIIDESTNKGNKIIYDEVNIKNLNITKEYNDDNYYYVEYNIESRYINYKLTSDDVVNGGNSRSISHNYKLILKKKKDTKDTNIYRCPGCERTIDVNDNGKCPYCNAIYDMYNYDYILDSIMEY